MAASITSPMSAVVNLSQGEMFIEWTPSTDGQEAYELQYKFKKADVWSTCGKVYEPDTRKVPITTIYNLVETDFYEIYYRIIVYFNGDNNLGSVTGKETSAAYNISFKHGIINTLKLSDGYGEFDYDLFNVIIVDDNKTNKEVEVMKISMDDQGNQILKAPLVASDSALRSNLRVCIDPESNNTKFIASNAESLPDTNIYGYTYINQKTYYTYNVYDYNYVDVYRGYDVYGPVAYYRDVAYYNYNPHYEAYENYSLDIEYNYMPGYDSYNTYEYYTIYDDNPVYNYRETDVYSPVYDYYSSYESVDVYGSEPEYGTYTLYYNTIYYYTYGYTSYGYRPSYRYDGLAGYNLDSYTYFTDEQYVYNKGYGRVTYYVSGYSLSYGHVPAYSSGTRYEYYTYGVQAYFSYSISYTYYYSQKRSAGYTYYAGQYNYYAGRYTYTAYGSYRPSYWAGTVYYSYTRSASYYARSNYYASSTSYWYTRESATGYYTGYGHYVQPQQGTYPYTYYWSYEASYRYYTTLYASRYTPDTDIHRYRQYHVYYVYYPYYAPATSYYYRVGYSQYSTRHVYEDPVYWYQVTGYHYYYAGRSYGLYYEKYDTGEYRLDYTYDAAYVDYYYNYIKDYSSYQTGVSYDTYYFPYQTGYYYYVSSYTPYVTYYYDYIQGYNYYVDGYKYQVVDYSYYFDYRYDYSYLDHYEYFTYYYLYYL